MARGNMALALSIYEAMCRSGPSPGRASQSGDSFGAVSWPAASLETVSAVVRCLSRHSSRHLCTSSSGASALLHNMFPVTSEACTSECNWKQIPTEAA